MLSFFRCAVLVSVLCGMAAAAQSYDVSVEEKTSHKNWGTAWGKIHVAKNNLITLAVVPNLGGRVMQYDLGDHAAIYVDDDVVGSMPADGNVLVGGFRQLPSPQFDFGWPSPPEVDLNPYTYSIVSQSADSVVLLLVSQVVDNTTYKYSTHQGLQFKRLLTLYKASTRVKVAMTMINTGTEEMEHGIWDITQCVCSHGTQVDTQNFWVYFKMNPQSAMNGGYVVYSSESGGDDSTQWKPNVAPGGIMGAQFQQKKGKIGADCNAGWICHVDRKDGYAYIKTFTYEEGKTYPDEGASIQVYTYSDPSTPTVEVEVQGPLTTLQQNDSVSLVENWYMARSFGPVLDVNKAGLVTSRLTAQKTDDSVSVTGTYGVFAPGKVYVRFSSATSTPVTVDSFTVTPIDSLRIAKKYGIPAGTTLLTLAAVSSTGAVIGALDTVTVSGGVDALPGRLSNRVLTGAAGLNISRCSAGVKLVNNTTGPAEVTVHTLSGRALMTVPCVPRSTTLLPAAGISNGIMIAKVKTGGKTVSLIVPAVNGKNGGKR